jgi:putative oxidoreductase
MDLFPANGEPHCLAARENVRAKRVDRRVGASDYQAMKFLHLNFLPRSADAALLIARLWFGGLMLWLHGWMKVQNFAQMKTQFPDPFGIGTTATVALVVFAEVVCAGLVVLGLFTRVAALILTFNMSMAFYLGHGAKLTGLGNDGEMAFLFVGAFFALFVSGGGAFSVDAKMGAKA